MITCIMLPLGRGETVSEPDSEFLFQAGREFFFEVIVDLLGVVAGAEVGDDDEFVVEEVGTVEEVVEVHVAELVDVFLAMVRRDEGQLANQDLGLVHHRVVVEARW